MIRYPHFTEEEWRQSKVKQLTQGRTARKTQPQLQMEQSDSSHAFNHSNVLPSASPRRLQSDFYFYLFLDGEGKLSALSLKSSYIWGEVLQFKLHYFLFLLAFLILFLLFDNRGSYFVHHCIPCSQHGPAI